MVFFFFLLTVHLNNLYLHLPFSFSLYIHIYTYTGYPKKPVFPPISEMCQNFGKKENICSTYSRITSSGQKILDPGAHLTATRSNFKISNRKVELLIYHFKSLFNHFDTLNFVLRWLLKELHRPYKDKS